MDLHHRRFQRLCQFFNRIAIMVLKTLGNSSGLEAGGVRSVVERKTIEGRGGEREMLRGCWWEKVANVRC